MNYISYKEPDGKIVSGFKIKLYDVIIIGTGYYKDELAIIVYINEEHKNVKCRIIKNGIDLNLHVKNITFVNHNNRQAAKSYIELCDKMVINMRKKYSSKQYIIDNWDKDPMIINDIVAITIVEGAEFYVCNRDSVLYPTKCLMWLTEHKDLIDIILHYGNADFINKALSSNPVIKVSNETEVYKLHNYFYVDDK